MSSKRQTLLDYLADTLLPGITTGNGYNFTVGKVSRGLQSYMNLPDESFPALFVAGADEERKNVTHKDFLSVAVVKLWGFVKNNESTLVCQQDLDKLIEDVTKLLYTDPVQGGKVLSTEIRRIETDDVTLESHAAFRMEIAFQYKTAGTAP